jgi:cellulose synthase operon protein C
VRGRRYVAAVTLAAAALVAACGRRPAAATSAPPSPAKPVTVEWAGCAVVRVGPRCELGPDRKLTVWVAGQEGPALAFAADSRPLKPATSAAMQDGWQLVFDIPRPASRLSATRPGDSREVWSLPLGEATLHPDIDDLVLAGKRGEPQAAARLREIADTGEATRRAAAEMGYGRVMLARGDANQAVPALRRAMDLERAAGRASEEMRVGTVLVWALAEQQQRFVDARTVLEALATARDKYPEGRGWYAYEEGLLAAVTGDLRTALASYRAAARIGERLGQNVLTNNAAEDLALMLRELGRFDEAVTILERLPAKTDACAHASLMINRAEALAEAAARDKNIASTRVAAALADEQRATSACADPRRRLLAAVHSTRQALAIGDRATADAWVARLRAEPGRGTNAGADATDPLSRALRAGLLGRWALTAGNARAALKSFDEQSGVAHAGGLRNERFRAEVGAGQALLALGRRAEAIRRLHVAQTLAQRMLEDVPIAEGRGEFLSSHDEGTRHLVDALVDGGAAGQAMAVARIARATEAGHAAKLDRLKALSAEQRRRWDEALERYAAIRRAIEQEATEEWKLPGATLARARADREIRADQARDALDAAYRLLVGQPTALEDLPRPRKSEVAIAFFPGAKGWIVFCRTKAGVTAHRFGDEALDSNASASVVLDRLSAVLQSAQRAVVFTFGRSDRIDWHAVTWRGAPLISKLAVEYGLDLPGVRERPSASGTSTSALLVANPTGDLAAANREGDLVAKALGTWRVARLDGPTATRDSVLKALPEVALFHYAGHAEMAGPSGVSSALVLTGGARAQVGDLLALPRLPGVVVLSACQGAATAATVANGASASMMGLAQAFLAAGAQAVVASTREVADAEAQTFMATLYETIRTRGLETLPEAFRRAAIGAVGRSGQSFRLITLAM